MKVLCEVPLNVADYQASQFQWVTNNNANCLFVVEAGKRLRILSIQQEPAEEIQSTALADSRLCTSFSWNRDASLLAIVVDKRQIYFWDVKTNTFTHYKPLNGQIGSLAAINTGRKSQRPRDIELVAWSKLTDKFVICYTSGQILLCKFAKNIDASEKFVDNSDSVLKRIVSIEVCDHADIFACFSLISEVLVMTFDGQTRFYVQGDGLNLFNAKFSNPIRELNSRRMSTASGVTTTSSMTEQTIWLAYQSKSDGLFFKKISAERADFQDIKPKLDVLHDKHNQESRLINFFWLTSTRLMACFSSGTIFIAQMSMQLRHQLDSANMGLMCDEVFNIGSNLDQPQEQSSSFHSQDSPEFRFKTFELVKCSKGASGGGGGGGGGGQNLVRDKRHSFALMAATDYKIFYYELHERDQQHQQHQVADVGGGGRPPAAVSFEQVDEVDLWESLSRINLKIERASWCHDCSMLAVQLTSGHILVYRTRLQYNTVASYGARTAYLSSLNEITVLNYGQAREQVDKANENATESSNNTEPATEEDAVILNVGLKPSIIAIGPKHLALALNNRVRFYLIKDNSSSKKGQAPVAAHFDEQEYATIVTGLKLNSNFVVIQFDDGRLKLQAISQSLQATSADHQEDFSEIIDSANDERFFPDPARPENIASFTLTELLLVYCTRQLSIQIFSLKDWSVVQTCDHSNMFNGPIERLVANEVGNKFVCLIEQSLDEQINQISFLNEQRETTPGAFLEEANIYLYDLYSNKVMSLDEDKDHEDNESFERLFNAQIRETLQLLSINSTKNKNKKKNRWNSDIRGMPKQVLDAIWDTDGRTLLLIERERVHVVAVLDHTLGREEPTVEYADSSSKPTSYTILYASQGIVSYQTSLGRVINAILETHDDEVKLSRLELKISFVQRSLITSEPNSSDETLADIDHLSDVKRNERVELILEALLDIMHLKLAYMRTILPLYSLPKCYDICDHLQSDEQFNLKLSEMDQKLIDSLEQSQEFRANSRLINQLIWKQLACWSIHCLNLEFALLVYRKHKLLAHSRFLADILDDLKLNGLDSRQLIKSRLLLLLDCDNKTNKTK